MSKIVIYGRDKDTKLVHYGNYNTIIRKWSNNKVKKMVESIRPKTIPEDLPDVLKSSRLWARKEQTKSLIEVLQGNR